MEEKREKVGNRQERSEKKGKKQEREKGGKEESTRARSTNAANVHTPPDPFQTPQPNTQKLKPELPTNHISHQLIEGTV